MPQGWGDVAVGYCMTLFGVDITNPFSRHFSNLLIVKNTMKRQGKDAVDLMLNLLRTHETSRGCCVLTGHKLDVDGLMSVWNSSRQSCSSAGLEACDHLW